MEGKNQMIITKRLEKGNDLKQSILKICQENDIEAGIIISSVGCVNKLHVGLAKAIKDKEYNQDLEILSLNGTCSKYGLHLHICVSDENGNTFGGHLLDGTIINTTCELAIMTIDNIQFKREYDINTGYKELVVLER